MTCYPDFMWEYILEAEEAVNLVNLATNNYKTIN